MTPRVEPTPLDKVLTLRPTNVVMRLGQSSRIPLLNPRDLVASFAEARAALLCVPAYSRAAIAGLLRASRDEDAVLGISCPALLPDRDTPVKFVETVRDAAEEVRHRKPLFLQAGPFRLASTEARVRDQAVGAVYKFVDAGFTLISLDASGLGLADAVAAYKELAAPALERELSIEIAAPQDDQGHLDERALEATLEQLKKARLHVNFVRLPGRTYALEEHPRESWQLDLSVIKAAAQIAQRFDAWLSLEDEGVSCDQLGEGWLQGGARKVDPVEAAARITLGTWPAALRDELAEASRSRGLHLRDLIAAVAPPEQDAKARLKIEALCWSLAVETMPCVGLRGTGTLAVAHLAHGGGY